MTGISARSCGVINGNNVWQWKLAPCNFLWNHAVTTHQHIPVFLTVRCDLYEFTVRLCSTIHHAAAYSGPEHKHFIMIHDTERLPRFSVMSSSLLVSCRKMPARHVKRSDMTKEQRVYLPSHVLACLWFFCLTYLHRKSTTKSSKTSKPAKRTRIVWRRPRYYTAAFYSDVEDPAWRVSH